MQEGGNKNLKSRKQKGPTKKRDKKQARRQERDRKQRKQHRERQQARDFKKMLLLLEPYQASFPENKSPKVPLQKKTVQEDYVKVVVPAMNRGAFFFLLERGRAKEAKEQLLLQGEKQQWFSFYHRDYYEQK